MVRNRSCRGRDSSSRVGGVSGTLVSSPRMERKSRWSGTGSVEGEQFLQGGERQRHCSFFIQDGEKRQMVRNRFCRGRKVPQGWGETAAL